MSVMAILGLFDLTNWAVAFYLFMFVMSPVYCSILTLFCVLFPPFWGFVLIYALWYWYDRDTPRRGSRPLPWFRRLCLWNYMAEYFSARLVKTADLPPDRNYIFGCHPHGVLCFGTHLSFGTDAALFHQRFPGLRPRIATLPMQFKFPIRRELFIAAGMITSDADSIEYVLKKRPTGQVVCIIPGGAEEALDCHRNNYDLTLQRRKGFVRLAIKNRAALVPVYNFGENQTYEQLPNERGSCLRHYQCMFKNWAGFAPTIFAGTGFFNRYFGFMPYKTPITTVVGTPIETPYHEDPPQDLVDKVHQKYVESLIKLFDEHKARYGIKESVELRIV